ncbi:hypothetical protein FRB95_007316 [Tulasnella sp. JGI-2019a]|nr:hypothetical protein FRB95_007316 [Tulasnella sp. JGI-2019a]
MSLQASQSGASFTQAEPSQSTTDPVSQPRTSRPGLNITVSAPPFNHPTKQGQLKRDNSGSFKVPTLSSKGASHSSKLSITAPSTSLSTLLSAAATILESSSMLTESPLATPVLPNGPLSALPTSNPERQAWKEAISELAGIVETLICARELIALRDEKQAVNTRLKQRKPRARAQTTVVDNGIGWGEAAVMAPSNSEDLRAEELDNQIFQLDEEINTHMASFESQLLKWASSRPQDDFWPFEPQGGRYLREPDHTDLAQQQQQQQQRHLEASTSQYQDALKDMLMEMTDVGPWIDALEQQWQQYTVSGNNAPMVIAPSSPSTDAVQAPKPIDARFAHMGVENSAKRRRLTGLTNGIAHIKRELGDVNNILDGLKEQLKGLEPQSSTPVVGPTPDENQPNLSPTEEDIHKMEEGTRDLQRLTALLVDWINNMDRFEQMSKERPGVIPMLRTQRERLSIEMEGLRARAAEQDREFASLKELVFAKLDLISPPNPPATPSREEAITAVARGIVEELKHWLNNEFEVMYQAIRDHFDQTGMMAGNVLDPVISLLDALLHSTGIDPALAHVDTWEHYDQS